MIEKMKKIIVVAPQDRKTEMVSGIRDLGVIHISETAAPNTDLSDRLSQLNRIKSVLAEQPKVEQKKAISGKSFDELHTSEKPIRSKQKMVSG